MKASHICVCVCECMRACVCVFFVCFFLTLLNAFIQ